MFYEIYLFDAPYSLDRGFDYESDKDIAVGSIVRVPFGRQNKERLGVVTKRLESSFDKQLKPVHAVLSDRYSLSEDMLGLCLFLKEYTLCTFGEAARAVLPPGALSEVPNIKYRKIYRLLIAHDVAAELLRAKGNAGIRSEGQRIVISYLLEIGSADGELVRELPGVSPAHISALVKKGIVGVQSFEDIRNPYSAYSKNSSRERIELSFAQERAYREIKELINENAPRAALLFGVTGSGKTKVIMRAIDDVIDKGKRVIMMVPEISLTPQTVSLFCQRYGERVAVIHSSLSKGERLDAWHRIRKGDVDLVIGTRSAIFAPVENLGLVVIDEEHEHTYKSESDPKYHARDVAAYLSGKNNCLMLLASATPSLESFYKAECGKYKLIALRERYGNVKLPDAHIVDMREEARLGNTSSISKSLLEHLEACISRKDQAILFLNRRGYNSQISCRSCGEVISCPRCSISLTYHTGVGGGKLLCHLCGHRESVPRVCPSCSKEGLAFLGSGTQKLESEIATYLPGARVMRMDADTTAGKLAYDRMLDDFRRYHADVLVGTQMVAKGHDFPKVTLVGVALADTSLYVSDFRASERTFSLLTQVIGRAGRAKDGLAVIQTYSPKNEIIRLACRQDYDKFYEGEIAIRRELSYPPFCDMASITLTADNEASLEEMSQKVSASVKELLEGKYAKYPFVVYGPHEAQVYKLNEKYRKKIVIKCKLNRQTREFFREILLRHAQERADVSVTVDLNPLTI